MRKNAFTLIELLAVIVILAIIALIAVPIVINIINDAKEESLKRSVQIYLDAVTNTITKENIKHKYNPDECIIQEDGNLICSENGNELTTSDGTKILKIDIKGKKPNSGTIKLKDGKITNIIDLSLNDIKFMLDQNGNIVINENNKIAGLYDENNNLLATWDELVNAYKLDITKDYTSSTYRKKNSGSMYDVLNNNDKLKDGKIVIIEQNETNNKIGNQAFYNCRSLTSIIIPNSVRSIGIGAFAQCVSLTNIEIPNSVTSIGDHIFYRCTELTSVTMGSGVTNIPNSTFETCRKLTNITIPSGVTNIGDQSFYNCISLTNITIPSGVTNIGEKAFAGCTGLTSVTIPNSVTSIGEQAFLRCMGLTSITIPSSVTSIGIGAFAGCSKNLESIKVESGNQYYKDEGVNAIIEKETDTLILGCKNTTIPDDVTFIGKAAFAYCTGLTSIIIPNSVAWIMDSAFEGCTGLTSIIIPNRVLCIMNSAFIGCTNLTSVTFENISGWYISESLNETGGTNIDVTDESINATNLKDTYVSKYWKRN